MQISEIENYVDYVLKVALSKCGDLHDAEDLAQETVMAAVLHISSGKVINKPKSWLYSVMNHKYHDMLRRKYTQKKGNTAPSKKRTRAEADHALRPKFDDICVSGCL